MHPVLLDCIYFVILIVGLPFVVYKTLTSRRFRAGWPERFGGVPRLRPKPRIWIHCASVGEVLLARSLVEQIKARHPGLDIVFSTNTDTGKETAQKSFPRHTVFYFPLDLSFIVRKVFRRIRPMAIILVELELWPNFLAVARRLDVPVAVVNGRITARSAARYRWLGGFARAMFRNVRIFAVQNREYAERLKLLGVEDGRIAVVGTMKFDNVPAEAPPEAADQYRRLFRLSADDTVLVAGCTHPGEDELLIDYVKKRPDRRLRLILAPRHREHAGAVQRLIHEAGFEPIRKTALDAGRAPADFERRPHVILIDTTGELARIYAVATVVFIGGTLVDRGGQNMIEPAALGKAVVFGPSTWNFRDPVELLLRNRAARQVQNAGELHAALDELIARSDEREELGRQAQNLIRQNQGSTERNLAAIQPFIDVAAASPAAQGRK